MPDKDQQGKDQVLQTVKEHNIKSFSLWFTDVLGFLKGFTIAMEELQAALEDGMGFDGSSIEGFARIDESDMVAMPAVLPIGQRQIIANACLNLDIFKPRPWFAKGQSPQGQVPVLHPLERILATNTLLSLPCQLSK